MYELNKTFYKCYTNIKKTFEWPCILYSPNRTLRKSVKVQSIIGHSFAAAWMDKCMLRASHEVLLWVHTTTILLCCTCVIMVYFILEGFADRVCRVMRNPLPGMFREGQVNHGGNNDERNSALPLGGNIAPSWKESDISQVTIICIAMCPND